MTAASHAGERRAALVDPQALARLRGVMLRARQVVDGVLQGLHKSPHQGASVEFAEHKEYAPGDEIKHVDWKAFARHDKYYVKKFEQETNLQAWLVVDASASMGYGADGMLTKFEYAATVATALVWLMLKQQDAVGLVKYDAAISEVLPPRSRAVHLGAIAEALETTKVAGTTNLEASLSGVVDRARRRGMVFLFSDFFGNTAFPFTTLRQLVGRGHDVTLFHVLDGDELTFPFREMTLFEGMESPQKLLIEPEIVRREYLARMKAHQADVRRAALEAQASYVLADTREAPGELLLRTLRERRRVAAGRGAGR